MGMNEKKWGITLIITSILLVTAISLLFFTLKTPDISEAAKWGVRIFAIGACAAQFIVFILFAKAYKKTREGLPKARPIDDPRSKTRK